MELIPLEGDNWQINLTTEELTSIKSAFWNHYHASTVASPGEWLNRELKGKAVDLINDAISNRIQLVIEV